MTAKQLEIRIAEVERELARLKTRLEGMSPSIPWWEQITGTFHEDAVYEKAMNLGRRYRHSQRPDTSEREGE
jgi:hypothetical protein